MQKLLFTLLLTLFTSISSYAQWEKCAEQKEIILGNSPSIFGAGTAQYKNFIFTFNHGYGSSPSIIFTTDRGINWKKLKMPNYSTGTTGSELYNQLAVNDLGIFYVTKNIASPNKLFITSTQDLGNTWNTDSLSTQEYSPYSRLVANKDEIFLVVRKESDPQKFIETYIYSKDNRKWQVYYNLVQTSNLGLQFQICNVSENRFLFSNYSFSESTSKIYIFDKTSKSLLKEFPIKSGFNDITNCNAVDSTIVYYYKNNQKYYIDVSKDLGKNWKSTEIDLPYDFFSVSPQIEIINKTIYVCGSKQILTSGDYGTTWKPITDESIASPKRSFGIFQRFIVTDSLLTLMNDGKIFTKKPIEASWTYAQNTFTDFKNINKINDTLIWATGGSNQLFKSNNYGKTWTNTPNDSIIRYPLIIKNSLIISPQNYYYYLRSNDIGKTWSLDTTTPKFSKSQIVGDTIFLLETDRKSISYSTKSPYTSWIKALEMTNNTSGIRNFYYNNGIIYFTSYNRTGNDSGISRIKFNGTSLNTILLDEPRVDEFLVQNNEIYYTTFTNTIRFGISNDNGNTWKKNNLPTSWNSIFKVDNYLLASSTVIQNCGNLNNSTGGIYLSADYGKSWFLFSEGINTECNNFTASFYRVDNYVYAKSTYGLWRIDILKLDLKSITGNVFLDKNKNGIKDEGEKGIPNANVFLSNADAFTTTDSLGNYIFTANLKAQDTLKTRVENTYAQYTPPFLLVNQSDTIKNLGVYIPDNVIDLSIKATAVTPPRSGFNNNYILTYKNIGTLVTSGKVSFSYVAKQTLVEASPVVTSNTNNTLSWSYSNLQPNESRIINLILKTALDMPIRTSITNVVSIDPITFDTFKANNIDSVYQTVVGSYDPNDKQITFLNTRQVPSVIDQNSDLTYTIRFQNTGNYQADFVRVIDTLNDKLDITTMKVLATSHNYVLSVKNKNVLIFEFNPIYLPDSTTNEKDSHGFIKFSIKPKRALTKDEVIKNTAQIFFDYNPAIITNTVETANQKVSGLFTPSVLESLKVYPNPSNGEISFNLDKFRGKEMNVNVYSIDGKLMMSKSAIGNTVNAFDASYLKSGLYLLQIKVENENVFGKFMIEK